MIAFDTNLLVYAYRVESPFHQAARKALHLTLASTQPTAVPWPCVHEFLAHVTNKRIYGDADSLEDAYRFIDALAGAPRLCFLAEGTRHLDVLRDITRRAKVRGPQIHDARIAAICIAHGVSELWTADRDFLLFPDLRVRNPLVESA